MKKEKAESVYYPVKELNDSKKKIGKYKERDSLKGTREYYYNRLEQLKKKRAKIPCPPREYKQMGLQPRVRLPTKTGMRGSIAITWDDTDNKAQKYYNRVFSKMKIIKKQEEKKKKDNKKQVKEALGMGKVEKMSKVISFD
jgi:hypothetical protein